MNQNNKPKISMIAGMTRKDRAIGMGNRLLVHISDDLKRFKSLTLGHPIIMGRKTYESIGKPLPGRPNFVITRNADFNAPGITVCKSIEDAIEKGGAIDDKEIFIIGGGEIYKQGLPFADRLYLTLVESDLKGDVFFPDYSEFKKVIPKEDRFDEKTGLKYSWVDMER